MITPEIRLGPELAPLCKYKFRSNSDLCLTGYLRQMLPGVFAYGVQFDLNLYYLWDSPPSVQ